MAKSKIKFGNFIYSILFLIFSIFYMKKISSISIFNIKLLFVISVIIPFILLNIGNFMSLNFFCNKIKCNITKVIFLFFAITAIIGVLLFNIVYFKEDSAIFFFEILLLIPSIVINVNLSENSFCIIAIDRMLNNKVMDFLMNEGDRTEEVFYKIISIINSNMNIKKAILSIATLSYYKRIAAIEEIINSMEREGVSEDIVMAFSYMKRKEVFEEVIMKIGCNKP